MQICMMDYGNLSADDKTAYQKCYGIGTFEVLTGVDFISIILTVLTMKMLLSRRGLTG